MSYEWDAAKAASNRAKHGVRFSEAAGVFEDPNAAIEPDDHADEERYVIVGLDAAGRLLVLVFTWRGEDVVRLISARKATREEVGIYNEERR
ncbi:MAG: BrnT family toxin [Gemmatimonadetes bacterium]|nr:BrnT family toxin [Gemmatimonadota bacterium]